MNRPEPHLREASAFARDLIDGMLADAKHIPAKYFYDTRGSALFEAICSLPEYYPTRVETALLARHAAEFARRAGPRASLVEFGAGALRKSEILLDALVQPHVYIPIDISGDFLRGRAIVLQQSRPDLVIRSVEADFTAPLVLPPDAGYGRRIGFFPGSTIGNLTYPEAVRFLRQARAQLPGGAMLVGVDLVKDPAILHAAYNDAAGVTAAFNKNVLVRANRECAAGFDPEAFAHYAFYSPLERRIEMHLASRKAQDIAVLGRAVAFAEGETIHTESSHKYTVEDFQDLALEAGFVPESVWHDEERLFSLHWLENPG